MNLTKAVLSWYEKNKRDLVWRETKDPYKIWVSEIIMQQTRIDQGTAYYHNFIRNFPTLKKLANSSLDEVLKVWEGLGYYNRARNMHQTAVFLCKKKQCLFPTSYSELIKLKGIGDYTAASIASLTAGEPVVAIDGNVMRFMSRYFCIEDDINSSVFKNQLKETGNQLIDVDNPGRYNQAMIEMGALQCVPKNPDCNACPVNTSCAALKHKMVDKLPKKQKKSKLQQRFLHYFIITNGKKILINRREKKDIWAGLYDFPSIETKQKLTFEEVARLKEYRELTDFPGIRLIQNPVSGKHVLSHQIIWATFYTFFLPEISKELSKRFINIDIETLNNYSLPRLISRFLETDNGRKVFKLNVT